MNTVNTSSVLATVPSPVENTGRNLLLSRPRTRPSTSRSSWSVSSSRLSTRTLQPASLPCVDKKSRYYLRYNASTGTARRRYFVLVSAIGLAFIGLQRHQSAVIGRFNRELGRANEFL